jgi:TolB-like protein/Tfp pilus assembly protein PilF
MSSFIAELRRRNVIRVAAAYALVAWIIIEAGSVLLPTFGASETTFQVYVIVVLLGFLVSLVLAWIFEITPDGVKLDKDVEHGSPTAGHGKGLTNYAIIGLLIVALGVSITFNVTGIRNSTDASAAQIMANRRSIAVLPFDSRSSETGNALFADGVHDDLLTKLANFGALKVISRTSVMEYRGTTKNLRDIGEELGVDTLLEGTVQRVGNNVRINVQLIDAETDEHLWANIYDRSVTDENLFMVQSEVSGQIAAALHSALIPTADFAAVTVPTENLRAYGLYQSGRDDLAERRLESIQESRRQFEQAVSLDPDYAEAHIALAESLILLVINHGALPRDETFALAEQHIEKGLELNPELSSGYATLGLLKTSIWSETRIGTENLEAETAFERALALNPNNAQAYMWFASLRDAEQRTDEAIGFYHRSMQLDPLGRIPYNNLPTLYAQRGENEYAIRLWLDAIEIHPDWPVPYQLLTAQLAAMGRLDEAVAWQRLTLEKSSDEERMGNLGVGLYAEFGDFERAKQLLDDLPEGHPIAAFAPGFRLMLDREFEASSAFLVDLVERNPDVPLFAHQIVSDVALLAGDYENAREHIFLRNPVLQLDTEVVIDRFTVRDVVKLALILKQEGDTRQSAELASRALPVVQSLPLLGIYGQGVREAQIYAILGRVDDVFDALDAAIDAGYRSSTATDQWTLDIDPFFAELRGDERFINILARLDALNAEMYERVLEAESSGDWQPLIDLAGST